MCLLWGTNWCLYPRRRHSSCRIQFNSLPRLASQPWEQTQYVPPKCQSTQTRPIRPCGILLYCARLSSAFCLLIYEAGVEPSPLLTRPFSGPQYSPRVIDGDNYEAISGMNEWQRKPKYSEEICPSAAVSTTDPTWLEPGSNPGRRCGKPATDRLSYGTAPAFGILLY
jgi:hypothetical protein